MAMSHCHGKLPRMPYEPDPTRWPARCAAYLTQARALLAEPTALLETDVWVNELVAAEGLGADVQQALGASDRVQVAELEYLAREALHQLEAIGDIRPAGDRGNGSQGQAQHELARAMGWEQPNSLGLVVAVAYRPAVQLLARQVPPWSLGSTWPSVDALLHEAWTAHRHGLYVASAVCARVAVEEACWWALDTLDPGQQWEPWGAAKREEHLATLLPAKRRELWDDAPLDGTGTFAALSGVRGLGNDVAHNGQVNDALLHEALVRQLPRAVASLSGAVGRA